MTPEQTMAALAALTDAVRAVDHDERFTIALGPLKAVDGHYLVPVGWYAVGDLGSEFGHVIGFSPDLAGDPVTSARLIRMVATRDYESMIGAQVTHRS